jgi:high-affinity K+ transport system ATPase subunit B
MNSKNLKILILIPAIIVLISYILDIFNIIELSEKFNFVLKLLVIIIFILSLLIRLKSKE